MPRIDYHDIGHLFPLADIAEYVCSKLSIFRGADLTDISVLRLLDQVAVSTFTFLGLNIQVEVLSLSVNNITSLEDIQVSHLSKNYLC